MTRLLFRLRFPTALIIVVGTWGGWPALEAAGEPTNSPWRLQSMQENGRFVLRILDTESSSEVQGHPSGAALESEAARFWAPAPDDVAPWWRADLGEPVEILGVRLDWTHSAAVTRGTIEVSEDAVRWYPVATWTGGENESIHLQETHRRYLRVRIDKTSGDAPVGLREVKVVGRKSEPLRAFPEGPATLGCPRPVIPLLPVAVNGVDQPIVSLNGDWRFTANPPPGFWRNSVTPANWERVPVPGNLALLLGMEVTAVEREEGTGWLPDKSVETAYKRRIEVPAAFRGRRTMLRFDAAFNYARVWVNGELLRTHRGGFTPFYVDATDAVVPGEPAWVTVGLTAEAPFAEYLHVRGLVADVSLVAMAPDYPTRLQVHTRFDEEYRDAVMRVQTAMIFHEADKAEIVLRLEDMEGRSIDVSNNRIRVTSGRPDAEVEIEISRPEHWTAESPYLYTLTADVQIGGRTVQTIQRRFGFRDVEVRGNKFYVNGRQVKLRGVNWHQVHPHLGVAVSREHDLESLRLMREANVNLIRTSHWPQFEHVLEAADELGFYVLQENSVMFVGWPDRGEMLDDASHLDAFMGQFADMVELSRSHPSVIMWSTGNESRWGENIRRTQRYAHAIDPERRPTIFSWGHQAPDDGYEVFSHHYPGLGETYSRDNVPVLFDEYAHLYTHSDAWVDYDPAFRDFYGESLRYFWDSIYRADGGLGGAIWHARDKLFYEEDRVWDGFLAQWGLLDVWNRPKPEYYHVRMAYSPIRIEERTLDPSSGPLTVEIENRFHHTNLQDLDVYWMTSDESGTMPGPDVGPMGKGVLELPDREWTLGDALTLRFAKEELGGGEREVYTHEFEMGRPVVDFANDSSALSLFEEEDVLLIRGENFELRFDRASGQILEWRRDGDLVVVGGPHLNLGFDGNLPGGPRPDPRQWELVSLEFDRIGEALLIRIGGNYGDDTEVEFDLWIDPGGAMEVTYVLKKVPEAYDAAGVAFDIAKTVDRISWQRRGLWTVYPDNQPGRNQGVAYRERRGTTEETFGDWPLHPWAHDEKDFHLYGIDDEGGRGTRDFRASRPHVYFAELWLADMDARFQIAGAEDGSIKATLNPNETVRVDVNTDWSHPGFTGWGANPYKRELNLSAGYANRVGVRLAGKDSGDPVKYVRQAAFEAAALDRLKISDGRLGSEFQPERRAYRVVLRDGNPRLSLKAAHPAVRIYVEGALAGSGSAEVALPTVEESRTVSIDLVAPEGPVRRSYFLTLVRSDNLALDRPVTASSALGHHPARWLVDGDPATLWSTSDTGEWSDVHCDEWVQVDLEDKPCLARWKVVHDGGDEIYRTRDFQLEYSTNGPDGPWKIADQVRDNRKAITDRTLDRPFEARYVRLRVTKKSGDGAQWPAVRIGQLELLEK